MIDCVWIEVKEGQWRCRNCDQKTQTFGSALRRNCQSKELLQRQRQQMHERLLHKIDEAVDSGVATRSYGEIGRCLAVCQRCDCWMDERCGEDDMCTNKARQVFFMRLTKASLGCDRWSKRDPEEQRSE